MNELAIIDTVEVGQVQATMQKISQFQAVVQGALRKDHDYGVIPGTGTKPTLLKPGAEKILMLMGLTSEYEIAERVQDYVNGFFAFTVKCVLSKGDIRVTEGLGHANTKEARYARRWMTENKLPEGLDKKNLQKREKQSKYGPGTYLEYLVENDDPYTLVNTVLKMAKKRAQVDAALTVASLSEIFTQDLEDLKGITNEGDEPAPPKTGAPPPKPTRGRGSGNITDKQRKRMFALSGGNSDIVKQVLDGHGYSGSSDVPKADYDAICDEITALKELQEGAVAVDAEFTDEEPGQIV